MTTLHDDEFGEIQIRRVSRGRSVKIQLSRGGHLEVVLPPYAPLFFAKRLLASSRSSIRKIYEAHPKVVYHDGAQIGKSHWLKIESGDSLSHVQRGQNVLVTLPTGMSTDHPKAQAEVQAGIISALRKEAKSYLPRRLGYLADLHGFVYKKVRFSHARSRWGSCSTSGTISLNIALMRLDFDLIDYVLLHELAHTRHMNHSKAFWQEVMRCDPEYVAHRRRLRAQNPMVL